MLTCEILQYRCVHKTTGLWIMADEASFGDCDKMLGIVEHHQVCHGSIGVTTTAITVTTSTSDVFYFGTMILLMQAIVFVTAAAFAFFVFKRQHK